MSQFLSCVLPGKKRVSSSVCVSFARSRRVNDHRPIAVIPDVFPTRLRPAVAPELGVAATVGMRRRGRGDLWRLLLVVVEHGALFLVLSCAVRDVELALGGLRWGKGGVEGVYRNTGGGGRVREQGRAEQSRE